MNIAIFASIGSENLGDELILKNEIRLFDAGKVEEFQSKGGQENSYRVFSYSPKNPFFRHDHIQYLEYFPLGIRNPKNILRNLRNLFSFFQTIIWSDKIVIGGGGLFYDWETNNSALKQWKWRSWVFRLFRKQVVVYGVSIDVRDEQSLQIIRDIFSSVQAIYVRDVSSQESLGALGIKSSLILDPVYYDAGDYDEHTELTLGKYPATDIGTNILQGVDVSGKTIGIALRKLEITDYTLQIERICNYMIEQGGKVVLLPHSFHAHDTEANDYQFLLPFMKDAVQITHSMQETYDVYAKKKIDICIAGRFHAGVLAKVYKIPHVILSYAKKTESL